MATRNRKTAAKAATVEASAKETATAKDAAEREKDRQAAATKLYGAKVVDHMKGHGLKPSEAWSAMNAGGTCGHCNKKIA